jgi:hypothetical protein
MAIIEDIRAKAKELLEGEEVRAVLGYRRSTAGILAEPAFIVSPEEVDEMVLDATCVENLALYLVNEKKRQKASRDADKRPIAIADITWALFSGVVLMETSKRIIGNSDNDLRNALDVAFGILARGIAKEN